jgi:uncharacterized protein YlxP (DUF503 family)
MVIGVCTVEFHLPGCRSLKEKRKFLNSFRTRVSNRFNVAVSEIDHHDRWQRSTIGVVSLATEREPIDKMFQKILREAENEGDAQLISVGIEFL